MEQPLIVKPKRNSSVELFRIIATFSVMIAHFNGWFLSMPNHWEGGAEITLSDLLQNTIRSASTVCVNLFLIISGWYGVKLKAKSVWNLGIMLFFIYFPIEIVTEIYYKSFSATQILHSMLPFSGKGYYIQCYLMLLILSPLFNSFIERNDKQEVLKWTLLFLFAEFWYDIVRNDTAVQFNNGYSVLHFCVVYMLGRCFYLYKDKVLSIQSWKWISCYLVCVILLTVGFFYKVPRCWAYSNPIVIVASFCLFTPFVKISFYNKIINWFAISTLPVFIMHCQGIIKEVLVALDNYLYSQHEYWHFCIIILGIQILVFAFCVLYDKLRRLLTEPITDYIYKKIELYAAKINWHGK